MLMNFAIVRWLFAIHWRRGLAWVVAETALLCLVWVNVLASSPGNRISNPVGTSISSPAHGSILNSLREISGVSLSPNSASGVIELRLRDIRSGNYWDWQEERWVADACIQFSAPEGILTPWTIAVPRLSTGRYEIECRTSLGPESTRICARHIFCIDRTAPTIWFYPLHDQQTVGDFSDIGGELSESAEVSFTIGRVNELGQRASYWNGANWTASIDDAGLKLRATNARDFWFPSAETKLPKASQIEPGIYLISVSAIDRAGNEGRAAITVSKPGPTLTAERIR